jgi:hypothetical protein
MAYINKSTGQEISDYKYEYELSPYERILYVKKQSSSGSVGTSAIISAVTDSALLGGLIGGSLTGGIIGDLLDGDLFD